MKKSNDPLKKILVVEDDRALSEAISMKLRNNGFEVLRSSRVSDAFLTLMKNKDVKFIWLDHYLLGEESGFDFVVKVKEEGSEVRDIPIFVVSNTASVDKIKSYIKLGVDKYYIKAEHSLEDLIEEMKNFV
ncbi:hypothetical protein CVU82_01195 [Candidatus Falkowbacteria bacterium HGW-Falkowbacteria-1]|jgi:DNA-binding response OmpR family regulator|uniref:Response regulatory domain-containing protein n=1 Tax=Candidatus Falkowbacteria bacterium HGW-Falkowbacteria-1 TaxID=2013768 RepID=A0A2N2EAV3_9BACT|nr:MAG: hypothetical protein CVU82_01195 [Candidatus Falkowbacteria bacterium HGW-Falkowbacteria-1]